MLEFLDSNQLLNVNLVQNVRLELFEKVFFLTLSSLQLSKRKKKTTTTTKQAVLS